MGIKAFTANTITDSKAVDAEMELTRKRGYSISLQQYDLAQSGVAAPIFDHHGRVTRVLCSLAFSSELDAENVDRTGQLLAECGMRITERIGGRNPNAAPA